MPLQNNTKPIVQVEPRGGRRCMYCSGDWNWKVTFHSKTHLVCDDCKEQLYKDARKAGYEIREQMQMQNDIAEFPRFRDPVIDKKDMRPKTRSQSDQQLFASLEFFR